MAGLTRNLAFPAQWLPGTHEFYYRVTVAGGFAFIKENADNGQKGPAFDQTLVANGLSKAQAENVTALALPFDDFWYEDDGIGFYLHYEPWHCSLTQANCAKKPETSQPIADDEVRDLRVPADNHLRPSPDGKLQAHVLIITCRLLTNMAKPCC
ncbi:MAG: hypothetical protein LRY40_01365 [Shewanella fodinae]|nr:hypothetical protein [Shewanella fodinae]